MMKYLFIILMLVPLLGSGQHKDRLKLSFEKADSASSQAHSKQYSKFKATLNEMEKYKATMRQIHCNECGKLLFSTDKSNGAAGAEAQRKGFIYKLPVLFTDKYDRLFFCNKDCQKPFFDRNIPKNKEVSETLAQLKSEIPEMAKECAKQMEEVTRLMGIPPSCLGKK